MSQDQAAPHGASTLTVAVVTPEGKAFEGRARSVVVPGHDGEVAFYPLHAAFVGALGYGELRVTGPDATTRSWYVEGGVAEVSADDHGTRVTVLAERVLAPETLDAALAERQLRAALASTPNDEPGLAAREAAIRSAQARLRMAGARGARAAH